MDSSLLDFSVHGILQARILEWAAMPSRGSSQLRDWTLVSHAASRFFPVWATREEMRVHLSPTNTKSLQDIPVAFSNPLPFFQWIQILGLHLKLVQDISSRAFSRSYLCSPLSPNKAAETELQSHVSFFLGKKTFLHRLQKRWPCGMFKQLAKLKAVKDALLKLSTPFERTARRAVFFLL